MTALFTSARQAAAEPGSAARSLVAGGLYGATGKPGSAFLAGRGGGRIAVIMCVKPLAILVTLRVDRQAEPYLDEDSSTYFVLETRSAYDLRRVHREMGEFLGRHRIEEVFFRTNSGRGDYAADPQHTRIEAALQFLPDVEVLFVNAQSGSAWMKENAPTFPPALSLGVGRRFDIGKLQAVALAMYLHAHRQDPSIFFTGDGVK